MRSLAVALTINFKPTLSCQHALLPSMSLVEPVASALSILLIDDEPTLRLLMQKALTIDRHKIAEASDGAEGLAQYYRRRPDLILLDVNMPNVDGLTVLHEIRRQDAVVGIILVSGIKRDALADAAARGGADGYLQKPLHLPTLRQEVQRVGALAYQRRFDHWIDDDIC